MPTGFLRTTSTECDRWPRAANGRNWFDLLIASLTVTQAPITGAERDELRSLLEAMDMPPGPLAGLNAQG
jgi:hypothetical protein